MSAYSAILWAAFLWAAGNCVHVYIFRAGAGTYRIESAVLLLVFLLLPRAIRSVGIAPPPIQLPRVSAVLVCGVAVVLWIAIYAPLMTFPFLSDDYVFLERYQQVSDVTSYIQFYRPLFALVFWALSEMSSGSPVPFHLVSLALHLSSASLLYVLAARVFASNGPAAFCFAGFLLNPLQLEAVLWVSGLQELLWAFFVLAALVIYTTSQTLSVAALLGTVATMLCGLMSKETAVCAVLLLPLVDLALFRFRRGRFLPLAYVSWAIAIGIYLVARTRAIGMEGGYFVEPTRYFLKQFVTTPYRFFVQPWNLQVADIPTIVLLLCAILVVGLLFWSIAIRRSSRVVWIGALIVLASTLPVYSYFFVREDLLSARYLYFAACGWNIVLASLVGAALPRQRAFAAASMLIAAVLAASLYLNLRPWTVAAGMVLTTRQAITEGRSPDPIPTEYRGVGIFINGYDEFVRISSRR